MIGGGDAHALAFRMETLRMGTWPTTFVCLYLGMYLALHPEHPNRLVFGGLLVCALFASLVVLRLPLESIVGSRWREPFCVTWSTTLIGLIAVACWMDGGAGSPVEALFFLPLIFAALSYPLASMLLVGAIDVGAYLLIAAHSGDGATSSVVVISSSLVVAAWMCAWQSRNHDRHRQALELASRTDPLTGCLNRRGFSESFERLLARARRTGEGLTLVVLDLDDFKEVNDRDGHAAGDALLCWVTARLAAELRAGDVVARVGGDEFALLLPAADSSELIDRVSRALAERAPASVGAAVFGVDGWDADSLARRADALLYEDKRARRLDALPARAA